MDKKELERTQKELAATKQELDEIKLRRRELMWRLRNNGKFTLVQIASIYGCKKQYVHQELQAYRQQQPA